MRMRNGFFNRYSSFFISLLKIESLFFGANFLPSQLCCRENVQTSVTDKITVTQRCEIRQRCEMRARISNAYYSVFNARI